MLQDVIHAHFRLTFLADTSYGAIFKSFTKAILCVSFAQEGLRWARASTGRDRWSPIINRITLSLVSSGKGACISEVPDNNASLRV